ncbi:acidic mammalian chitinase-like [Agrilus planipennis]|uniref:Acidic mammalian chitinase-like n=1 Tax=Agrilus planipennis TaxID=224129 RepID=A0A7F5QYN6_AGRPL|nr:acidic mammalian chitinase-like [Agrilus planipennis]
MVRNLLFLVLCGATLTAVVDSRGVVGCYYGSWAINRPGIGSFGTSDIDPSLCTHIYYSFIGLNNATQDVEILDPALDVNRGGFRNLTNLKAQNPGVKFLVAMGGWGQGSYAYSLVAANATKRATFIQQVIILIQNYGFDGLDLDWEYPTQRDSALGAADRDNLITLLQEVKAAFLPLGLLITVAVGSSPSYINVAYDVPALSNVADLINFMTYDLHGSWDGSAGVNAPLHDPTGGINVEQFVNGWLNAGVDPDKLIVGIPFYGKLYTLRNSSDNSIGAPISGPGIAGPYLQDPSNLAYYEILEKLQQGWTEVYDQNYESPYAYSGNQWVGYDNVRSIAAKVNFVCSNRLGGVMNWAIDEDDFDGNFGPRYPLLRAMNAVKSCGN